MSPNTPPERQYHFESWIANALIQGIVEAGGTPYILALTRNIEGAIPPQHREIGKITLNVSSRAAPNLSISKGMVSMRLRFNGRDTQLSFPAKDILAVYDHDTGSGRGFAPDPTTDHPSNAKDQVQSAAECAPQKVDAPAVKAERIEGNVTHVDFASHKRPK